MFSELRSISIALAIASALVTTLAAQEAVTISDPRVLDGVVVRLQQRGFLVTYEEAPYDPETELSTTVYSDGTRFRAPLWRPEVFDLPAGAPLSDARTAAQGDPPQDLAFVERLVSEFNKSGNPGNFKVSFDDGYANIIPAGRRSQGRLEPFDPILSTKVIFPPQARLCLEVLNDLFNQLKQLRGASVVEGNFPIGGLLSHSCAITGNDLTARQALIQILTQIGASGNPRSPGLPYAWELCYDANWDKYFLSAAIVPITRVPAPRAHDESVKPNAVPSGKQGFQGMTVTPAK